MQKGGADTPTVPLLPHRKWRMEFQTDQFPDYDRWMTPSSTPLYQAYTLTERFSLPGTSEEVQLFLLPLRGRDGTMYGLCGFEISQSFFKQNFAQPTGFDHLICLLAPADSGLNASAALSSGTTGGYFHAPREMLVLRSMGSSLTQLIGSDSAYAGISELCRLSENQSYRLAVCIPMTDYRRLIFSGNLQMLLIGLFILFFVVFCCMYFHQHILSPAFRQFEEDRRESRRRMDELQLERQQMQTELSRLADVCRNESVPDAFQTFVAGIPTLTKTERRIFDGYAAGLRSREIAEQLAGRRDRRRGSGRHTDRARQRSAFLHAASDLSAKASRTADAGVLSCAAAGRTGRTAAFQAGARSRHGRAAGTLYAGGAARLPRTAFRAASDGGAGHGRGACRRFFMEFRCKGKYYDRKSGKNSEWVCNLQKDMI